MFLRFGLEHTKGSKYPMDPGYHKLVKESKPLADNTEYRSLIGSLLYVSVNSRPDITASVGILSCRVSCPSELDWTEARRVLRYLHSTKDYALKLGAKQQDLNLMGYCDADWATDVSDRKPCSGYLFQLGGATIS
ncbi:uncharacterized protein LOC129737782 [Uranotaenia lowii]|uniref:uncharacterized protein LOC129737782 n=1 Tax=Uranotaenia lowii TaxID=190385 RepID=UPI00247AD51F|nr:uncharacterized protein LOC129737782 [Uranotaenia lowii]